MVDFVLPQEAIPPQGQLFFQYLGVLGDLRPVLDALLTARGLLLRGKRLQVELEVCKLLDERRRDTACTIT